MAIVFSPQQKDRIYATCEAAYPEEGCGILLGQPVGACKQVLAVRPSANVWDASAAAEFSALAGANRDRSRQHNFAIAPAALFAAQKEARAAGLEIIGIFHSHTDAPAVPSEFDRAIAWAEYSYIIVSVENGRATDFRCWQLNREGQFQAERCSEADAGNAH